MVYEAKLYARVAQLNIGLGLFPLLGLNALL